MPSCFLRQDQRAWMRMLSALRCRSRRPNLSSSTAIRVQFCLRSGLTSRSPEGLWAVRVGAGRSQYNDVVITLRVCRQHIPLTTSGLGHLRSFRTPPLLDSERGSIGTPSVFSKPVSALSGSPGRGATATPRSCHNKAGCSRAACPEMSFGACIRKLI